MKVTLEFPQLLQYALLGWRPEVDDPEFVLGISMVAYISKDDKLNILLPAAKWHDAAYIKGSSIQNELDQFGKHTWPRSRVDARFLHLMLDLIRQEPISIEEKKELEKGALTLYLITREYGSGVWEGVE